jgi:hypothetical protein
LILVETKDQNPENILIAIQRNLSFSCFESYFLYFQKKKRQRVVPSHSSHLPPPPQHHRYLELNDETTHSMEEDVIPSPSNDLPLSDLPPPPPSEGSFS